MRRLPILIVGIGRNATTFTSGITGVQNTCSTSSDRSITTDWKARILGFEPIRGAGLAS